MIFSERLLSSSKVTLTVVTNPASATCTLTYNGVQYSTKSLEVDKGSSISYSVYHSTYGTTTGTIVMDSNKTLTCNGTYSTSITDVNWSQPVLTTATTNKTASGSNSKGQTLYITASKVSSATYAAYKAFDNDSSTFWSCGTNAGYPQSMLMQSTVPLKVSKITIRNRGSGSANTAYKGGTIYAGNTSSTSTTLTTFSNSTVTAGSSWTITVPTSQYYSYYKISFTSGNFGTQAGYSCAGISLTATYKQSSYNYYWDKTTNLVI